jgi:glycosyltransferase involved in cell wall biosynthesis
MFGEDSTLHCPFLWGSLVATAILCSGCAVTPLEVKSEVVNPAEAGKHSVAVIPDPYMDDLTAAKRLVDLVQKEMTLRGFRLSQSEDTAELVIIPHLTSSTSEDRPAKPDAVAEVLRSKGYTGDLTVCPLPFDSELYHPRSEAEFPSRLRRDAGEVLIGYVGRIVEAKGLRTLVEALALLPRPGWKLALVGAGPFEREFGELIRNKGLAGRVVQLGFVPHEETPGYLAAFDVLVLPSETQPNWKEQFGRVIVEALACGTPVIGSDSGEIPNLVLSSGGGLVFPERNAAAFADKLRTMISDPTLRQRYAENGRQWALKYASLPAVGARMAESIETVLRKAELQEPT